MIAPQLHLETPEDSAAADVLIARAFGPGRFAKTAERLREGRAPRLDICIVARADGRLVGCVRQWPIVVGETPSVLLGPIAVDPEFRSLGIGADMVRRACEASAAAGFLHTVLVGDAIFFEPLGFTRAVGVILPGPVDPRRVFIRSPPGATLTGFVRA